MTDASSWSLPRPETEGVIDLSDGRQLGYAAYGPQDGDPLLFFHGTPGSRYTRIPDRSVYYNHGVRQVTLERPGSGLSTFDAGRTLLDWPADVREAADSLGFDRFAVAGESGGGPYALACAARLPDRLRGVGVVGGLGPLDEPGATDGMTLRNRLGFKLATVPLALRPFLWLRIRKIRSDPESFIDAWAASAPEPDERILQRPAVREMVRQYLQAGVRQGVETPLQETRLHVRPWGFNLANISTAVTVWHGGRDTFVPASMARHIVEAIPSCTANIYPDAGHLLIHDYADEILSALSRTE